MTGPSTATSSGCGRSSRHVDDKLRRDRDALRRRLPLQGARDLQARRRGRTYPRRQTEDAPAAAPPWPRPCPDLLGWPRAVWEAVGQRASSSLTRRIVVLNLVGPVALLVGHPLPQPVPRGPDRGPGPEPADPGRDHRGRDRRLGLGGHRHDPHRSRQAAPAAGRRERPDGGIAAARLLAEPREGGAAAVGASMSPTGNRARVYDQRGRPPDPRLPPPLFKRGQMLAGSDCRSSRSRTSPASSKPPSRRSSPSSAACSAAGPRPPRRRGRERRSSLREVEAALGGNRGSLVRRNELGETDRLGGGADPARAGSVRGALLLSTQGGAIDRVVAAERVRSAAGLPRRRGGDGGAVVPAGGGDRRTGAPPRGGRRAGAHAASRRARRSRTSPTARTRSATCRAPCAT